MNVVKVSVHGKTQYALTHFADSECGTIDGRKVTILPAYFHSDGSLASTMCDGLCYNCKAKDRGGLTALKIHGCRQVLSKNKELHVGLLAQFHDPEEEAQLLDFCM